MANINSPDMHGYKLLQQAVNMEIPVILMSFDDDAFLAMGALENGALLYIKKPVTMDMLNCLWQHVVREKMTTSKEKERLMGMANMKRTAFGGQIEEENNKCRGKKQIRGCELEDLKINNNKVKRKVFTEWTEELHEKFMDAVRQLGEGRCFPKEILELMNVPGLTRMQVASHLQKCRNDNWRASEKRKCQENNGAGISNSNTGSDQDNKPRRFGSMPHLNKNASVFQEHHGTGGSSKTHPRKEIPSDGGHENITIAPTVNSQQQFHEQFLSGPGNVRSGSNTSSYLRYPDDFFNFPDMESLMYIYSGLQQGSGLNLSQETSLETFHENRQICPNQKQNLARGRFDTKNCWSSETSNFESDSSEWRGQEN